GAPPEARATPAETPAETLATAEEPTSPTLPTDQAELTEAAPETQVEALAALAADAVDAQPGAPSQEHSAPLPDEALDALPDDAAALFGDGDSAQALVSGSVASAEAEEMLGNAADAFDAPPELAVMETVPPPEPVV